MAVVEKTGVARKIIIDQLRVLDAYMKDEEVNDIFIYPDGRVFVDRCGELPRAVIGDVPISFSNDQVAMAIRAIASMQGRQAQANTENSVLDADFDDLRISAIFPPVSPDGPTMCIRKRSHRVLQLEEYVDNGTLTRTQADFLVDDVQHGRSNIIVSGGTSTGKTTFLNALALHIPKDLRILTLEDTLELQIEKEQVLRLKTDPPHKQTMRVLVTTLLRQRPSRAIAGELRGEEASQVLELMNSGHDGIMTTIHANDAAMALTRLKSLVMMAEERANSTDQGICNLIAGVVGLVVALSREKGRRFVKEIARVKGYDNAKKEFVVEAVA